MRLLLHNTTPHEVVKCDIPLTYSLTRVKIFRFRLPKSDEIYHTTPQ